MVPVAMAIGDAAIVAGSRCGGDGGAVKEFSDDCPQSRNLKKEIDLYMCQGVFSQLTVGDRKSSFVFALSCLWKCIRNKSRLAAILFLCRTNLPRFDEKTGLIFT